MILLSGQVKEQKVKSEKLKVRQKVEELNPGPRSSVQYNSILTEVSEKPSLKTNNSTLKTQNSSLLQGAL